MKTRKTIWSCMMAAFLFAFTGNAKADFGLFSSEEEGYSIVIVTSNFHKSRILAELIQHNEGHPIILLPTGENKDTMFALGPEGQATKFDKTKFAHWLQRLDPKLVMFLGDERFASDEYVKEAAKLYPITRVAAKDMDEVAEAVAVLIDDDDLVEQYQEMRKRVDAEGRFIPKHDKVWEIEETEVVEEKK
ncbi:MAG: hypothetical protein MK193_09165 [Lentisphaeria bacterium]|nr:hypothetical protein [Lentisphaeria bacterium]